MARRAVELDSPWFTAQEAAAYAKVAPITILRACRRRDLVSALVGRHRRIHVSALDEWLSSLVTQPPFAPSEVVRDFAALLHQYRISTVVGDRYAGEWPREQFRNHGIEYQPSLLPASDLYRELLPALNGGTVELLEHATLRKQLITLERHTGRGGRDRIDHAPNAHDDLANAVAGVVHLLARERAPLLFQ